MNQLKEKYTFADFLYYICLLAVPIITALMAIGRYSRGWTVLYVLVAVGMLALVLKYYCSRCPHYTREGKELNCIFFWKLPKFFAPRPGPLNSLDRLVAFGAPAVALLFPLPWLFKSPGLLIIYLLSLAGFAATVRRNECGRCIYFECPMNQTPSSTRDRESGENADA